MSSNDSTHPATRPAPSPFQVDSLKEALALATVIVNPLTSESFRVDDVAADVQEVYVTSEATDEQQSLPFDTVSDWVIFTIQKVQYPSDVRSVADQRLTADQLDEKYNPVGDGEHPTHPRAAWREKVSHGNTLRSYWDWVHAQIFEEGMEAKLHGE